MKTSTLLAAIWDMDGVIVDTGVYHCRSWQYVFRKQGINFTEEENAADVVLYSELDSREALDVYQNHPVHVAVKDFIKNVRAERQVIDYEIS